LCWYDGLGSVESVSPRGGSLCWYDGLGSVESVSPGVGPCAGTMVWVRLSL